MDIQTTLPERRGRRRIELLDVARGVALVAMAVYHFTWDLEFFGYAEAGLAATGGWKVFARCIASSFLFLVGVSLILAHGETIRWRPFWTRWAMIVASAALITAVTWYATPATFIFFGILHQIALASLLGLLFLRLPAPLTLAAGAAVIALPFFFRAESFDQPWLWWTGLSPINPRSNDFVPLFPWFGAVLLGIAAGQVLVRTGWNERLARPAAPRVARPLLLAGRHSLAFYLIHQPVLIACLFLYAQVFPAPEVPQEARFTKACEASCLETRDNAFCPRYCGCMLQRLQTDGALEKLAAGDRSETFRSAVQDLAALCTGQTDDALTQGGQQ
ncbi:MAG: DUF1624 domain-containing protein [Rhizobiaceae bacterium]